MRTKIAAAAFVMIGAGATTVAALDPPVNMQGSDTLFLLTNDVINACPRASSGQPAPLGLVYVGSGSSNGQRNALRTCLGVTPTLPVTAQTVAPMSRFLVRDNASPANDICQCSGGDNAEGIAFALDGLGIIANGNHAPASCGGVAFAKTITLSGGGTYTANSAFDFLRVAYFGILNSDPSGAAPQCGGDVRRSLLGDYGNFFQAACPAGTGACPTGIRHLWRRDDASGTTDVFVSLLGGGAAIPKFCNVDGGLATGNGQVLGGTAKNGHDYQDNDPIRIPCQGNGLTTGEQVCGDAGQGHAGTLGMLLTIFVPETADVPASDIYPVGICTPGVFAALPATRSTYTGDCPGGAPSFGGKCLSGMFRHPDGSLSANCITPFATGRCPTLTPAGTDCRGANLWLRRPNGDIVIDTSVPASRTAPPVPPAGRLYLGAFYRIHTTVTQPNGTAVCVRPSSTEQIGCLSSLAAPCSVGFAGRAAADVAPATLLHVGGVANDITSIQNLVNLGPYPANPSTYPLARKLYLNTVAGFEAVTGQERDLATCFASDAIMDPIVLANGFIHMPLSPAGRKARCEDWDDSACGGASVNACANNPGPIPTGL
jgi:hypothetical protein